MQTTVKILMTMGLLASLGSVQAATDDEADKPMPATEHQEDILAVNDDSDFQPMYQFSRKSADYVAVTPVTYHQAEVLQLQSDKSGDSGSDRQQRPG
ncbi:hypothetical protein J2T55_002269 [Methylohalomonas lacus]|uniref:DUF2782 domain-containing protein n=1 Tax=Methylohalomonas lacus TaxID=398773 RepID=A0AAE3HMT6_9GAMM|nr:hypothetical protein [Methylohalomonas lacus]MCS3904233.1 hypothetical protein [Methylohalomonas lacus]